LKNVSTTCSSIVIVCLLLVTGCTNLRPNSVSAKKWPMPPKPSLVKIDEFKRIGEGFYISETNAVKLANNVDELKAYIEKLEGLIEKIKEYYK